MLMSPHIKTFIAGHINMTIYKSTKIGLAVAGFALAAQLVSGGIADDTPTTPAYEPTAQTQQVTTSSTFNECMSTRSGRSYEERSATDRSATERKTRSEIYAERETECNTARNSGVTNVASGGAPSTQNAVLKL
tara:strand:+ start:254081 stop:254482 length:402 start_codon:yes stop_codon:yes gene_type:complete